jgi:hypothetical protein
MRSIFHLMREESCARPERDPAQDGTRILCNLAARLRHKILVSLVILAAHKRDHLCARESFLLPHVHPSFMNIVTALESTGAPHSRHTIRLWRTLK